VARVVDAIAVFDNHLPVRIKFGPVVISRLPDVAGSEGASHAFVLIDEAVAGLPQIAGTLDALEASGVRVTPRPKPPGEPTVAEVEAVAAELASSGADLVVAIGGGSVMDTAKSARLVAGQGVPYRRFAAGEADYERPELPLVLIPTTAGTGSEVSGGAVITDEMTHVKAGIANPLLRAQHALVDPELTYGLPPAPTAYAGVDALAQAIAAIAVTTRSPIGDAIALESIRLGAAALPAVVRDGSDRAARSAMACASLMAGLSMNISDCGAEHSLAQAIGGRFGLPHGLTIGLVLAETIEHDRLAVPSLFERIADSLGERDDGTGDGSRAVRGVRRILAEIDFPTLESVGVSEADVGALADDALKDYFITVAPLAWSRDDVIAAFEAGLAVTAR
jgi:alcohol dehydrogenase